LAEDKVIVIIKFWTTVCNIIALSAIGLLVSILICRSYCARSVIGYWHENVVCLSVRQSVTKCIVGKRYIRQKCITN